MLGADDILDIAEQRTEEMANHRARWDILSAVYHGKHKELWPQEFNEGEVPKNALFVRRSWDMFAHLVSKVPDVRSQPLALGPRAQSKADTIEKICFSFNNVWAMPEKADVMSHFLVGLGAFGAGVIPDPATSNPVLLVEDPRNVLPGPGWDSTSTHLTVPTTWTTENGGVLDDCIVKKTLTGRQLRKHFPNRDGLMESIPDTAAGFREQHEVWMYYDEEVVQTVWGGQTLAVVPHGCGWCPWFFPTIFAVDAPAGSAMFEQQFGLELAFMRIINQMLAMNDGVSWPWIFLRGHVKVDPRQRLLLSQTPDSTAQVLSPPTHPQMTQNLALIRDLLRQFNMESEASQGTVSGGPITGQGLIQLDRVTVETVRFFFRKLSFLMPRLYASALMIDRAVFGGQKKAIGAKGRGGPFFLEYTPAEDIGERFGAITVEYGPGLGGYEDFIKLLQALGADVVSEDTIMEQLPWIQSTSDEKRKIIATKLRKVLLDQALVGQAAVPIPWLAQAIEAIEGGKDPTKWFAENPPVDPNAPPPTPEMVPPLPPGAPSELAAAMGGGAPPGAEQMVMAPPLGQLLGI